MCRVYGYVGKDRPIGAMEAAGVALAAGGPDGRGAEIRQGWGLGANRLAIQGGPEGDQPYALGDSLFAVFNGEIFNFLDLRADLHRLGYDIHGECDGSVLLPLYRELGLGFLSQLDGMYCLAIVDLRGSEPELVIAVDPLGIRSVYYSESRGGDVVFASELQGLWPLLGKRAAVEPTLLHSYFEMQCLSDGLTPYPGVRRLRAGECLRVQGGRATTFCYGDGRSNERTQLPNASPTLEAAGETLHSLLRDEARKMSLSAGPYAIQLSGGLDSSLLATLFGAQTHDLTAFHVSYACHWSDDERRYAKSSADFAGIDMDLVLVEPDSMPEAIPALVRALGMPNAAPHALSAHLLFERIASRGIRICLSGEGADEQFGGYRRYSRALEHPGADWWPLYLDRLAVAPTEELRALLRPRERIEAADTSVRRRFDDWPAREGYSRATALLEFDRRHKLPHFNLAKLDHLAMAHGVEARVPYCQPAITRFARSLPPNLLFTGDTRKRVLFEAARDSVPRDVLERPKQPFTLPLEALIAESSSLARFLADRLGGSRLAKSGILETRRLEAVWREAVKGSQASAQLAWAVVILDLWLEQQDP